MTEIGILQVVFYLAVVGVCVKPLGGYMARVYEGKSVGVDIFLGPLERLIYRCCRIHPEQEMEWKSYLSAMLLFNLAGLLAVYAIQRLQFYFPFNPQNFSAVLPDLAFNTAASFVTNTNWEAYSGESTLSYLTQMMALTVQNFLSAATGLALLIALIRGIARREGIALGNFWVDIVRSVLYILIPLSFIFTIILTSQGVIQNYHSYQTVSLVQPMSDHLTQEIPMGPAASQIAIKQLGTNGGGFFNTNSAHPFENPTPLTNFLEMLAILLIPASLCYTYGVMVEDKRQGWAILAAMFLMFVPLAFMDIALEEQGNPAFNAEVTPIGNMEGKETRFGVVSSALWASATTATSNGSVNAMHDSFTPLGGFISLWLMHLGEVVFGGVGSGLYGMVMLVIITVFIGGLMVGRTPEYLGKKIEPYEMKMACVAVLLMPLMMLVLTAVGVVTPMGKSAMANPGAHGLTEVLYAFTSMGNNNGSAFAGLNANTFFYNCLGGLEMLLSRYWIAIPVLAIAGSLIRKKKIPRSPGTLSTHTFLFIFLLIGVTFILSALSFLPVLALGPVAEQLNVWGNHVH